MARRGRYAGRILVATPAVSDFFNGTVVLILQHDDDGTQGVILNKPLEAGVDVVLPQWHSHVIPPPTLYNGGPVGRDSAIGLVRIVPDLDPASAVGITALDSDVGLVDLDAPTEVIMPQVSALRVFIGYAGWTAGQLADEVHDRTWQVVDHVPGDPFWPSTATMWRDVLARQRSKVSWLSTYTEHPDRN